MNGNNTSYSAQGRAETQAGLLSLLHPRGMLRFTYICEDGRLRIGIEGSEGDPESNILEKRLELALETLRSEGMVFDQIRHEGPEDSGPANGRWLSILPEPQICSVSVTKSLGFASDAPATQSSAQTVALPRFPRNHQRKWLDFVPAVLLREPSLSQMEVEFKARELTQPEIESLRSLFNQRQWEHETLFGKGAFLGVADRFLGMWLHGGRGWTIRCRVLIGPDAETPHAMLEMLANEIFGTPHRKTQAPLDVMQDLSSFFPEGWDFAPLLPPPTYFDELSAQKLLNTRIPRLPKSGILLGHVENQRVRIPHEMRDRHCYIVGATGTGKSTLLFNLIKQDMDAGEGVILLDPHGDLFDKVLESVPSCRRDHLTVIDPLSEDPPPGINFLDVGGSFRPDWKLRYLIGELLSFFSEVWDMRIAGGPMFEMYFRNGLLLLADEGVRENSQHTLLNFASVLADKDFRNQQLAVCRNEEVKMFWNNIAVKAGGEASLANIVPYIVSKLDLFTQSAFIKTMISQPTASLRIGKKMDKKQIVLCNLNKGLLGATESRLLGTMLLAQIFAAGLERGLEPKATRTPVNIYVDEFQNFVSDNMASMLSEARKFGLRLNLANQTLGQLDANQGRENLTNTVLGNVGHLILFRLGVPDAEKLRNFTKPISPEEMQMLPNYHAFVRILTAESPLKPLVMGT